MAAFLFGLMKSKTWWFNAATLAAAIVASEDVKQFISLEWLVKIQALVNILLRIVTTQSVSAKGSA